MYNVHIISYLSDFENICYSFYSCLSYIPKDAYPSLLVEKGVYGGGLHLIRVYINSKMNIWIWNFQPKLKSSKSGRTMQYGIRYAKK
jgi:hypothetical protein